MHKRTKIAAPACLWLLVAGMLVALCLIYTGLYSLGVFNLVTSQQEYWLLLRPKTKVDCVLLQWSTPGSVPVMLLLTVLLGLFCWRLGYGRRTLLAVLFIRTLPDEDFKGQIKCEERGRNHQGSATFRIAKDQHLGLLHLEADSFRFSTMVNMGKEAQIPVKGFCSSLLVCLSCQHQ